MKKLFIIFLLFTSCNFYDKEGFYIYNTLVRNSYVEDKYSLYSGISYCTITLLPRILHMKTIEIQFAYEGTKDNCLSMIPYHEVKLEEFAKNKKIIILGMENNLDE